MNATDNTAGRTYRETYMEAVRISVDAHAAAGTLSEEITARIDRLIEEAQFELSAPGTVAASDMQTLNAREVTSDVDTLNYVREGVEFLKVARWTEAAMRDVSNSPDAWEIYGNLCVAEDIAEAGLNGRAAYGDAEGMPGPGEDGAWDALSALERIVYLLGRVAETRNAEAAAAAQLAAAAPVETDRSRRAGRVRRWIAARFSR